jgi:hypothetical protein
MEMMKKSLNVRWERLIDRGVFAWRLCANPGAFMWLRNDW